MTMQDFRQIYQMLLDECLGLRGKSTDALMVGDPQLIRQKVEEYIDINKTYRLAVAGRMMEKSASIYRITNGNTVINEFALNSSKKEFSDEESKIGQDVARGIFTTLTKVDVSYSRESQETRMGTIFTPEGEQREVLLSWLEEIERSTDEEEGVSSTIISPITGQYYNQDSLVAKFVYYEEYIPRTNSQRVDVHQVNYNDVDAIYRIIGEYGSQPFEVVFRDVEKLIVISTNYDNRAVIPMINENTNSRKVKIKMKDNVLSKSTPQDIFRTLNVDASAAEWYPIYTTNEVDDETVTEIGYFIMLLFFAIGHSS